MMKNYIFISICSRAWMYYRLSLVFTFFALLGVSQWSNGSANFQETMALVYPGCNDPLAVNYDPMATSDDGSCEYPILSCGPDTYTYCYSNNEFIRFYYEASSGTDLYVLLNGGMVQGGADFFFIWDNHSGLGS